MQALLALVSPERKRAKKTEEIDLSEVSDVELLEEREEEVEVDAKSGQAQSTPRAAEQTESQWTKEHQDLLKNLAARMQTLEETVQQMMPELSQCKLTANMSQSEAEEANEHAGLAHAAGEEAANMVTELRMKTAEMEAALIKRQEVEEIVQAAMEKLQRVSVESNLRAFQRRPHEQSDKFSRTIVIGGFQQDSMKAEVETHIEGMVKAEPGYEDHYAYRRGSIGFVRFKSADQMWTYLKKVNAKGRDRPTCGNQTLWVSASRSPEDRRKRKNLDMAKKVLVDVGLASEEQTEYDLKRGLLWIGRQRVAEWQADSENLLWNNDALKKAGVDVDGKSLGDAVSEKLQAVQ